MRSAIAMLFVCATQCLAQQGSLGGVQAVSGAYVLVVPPGSAAARAGLLPGDLVYQFNGVTIATIEDMQRQLATTKPGQTFPLSIVRAGRQLTLNVTLQAPVAPPAAAQPAPAQQPAQQPAQSGANGVRTGSYDCWANGMANLGLAFTVTGPGKYRAADGTTGTFTYDPATTKITFTGYIASAIEGYNAVYYFPKGTPTLSLRSPRSGAEVTFCELHK